jgi:hypothetical protein
MIESRVRSPYEFPNPFKIGNLEIKVKEGIIQMEKERAIKDLQIRIDILRAKDPVSNARIIKKLERKIRSLEG